jgi:hypothetical protein
MSHAIDTFLTTAATLQRKDLKQSVQDFVALDEPKTKAKPGERAQMGKGYLSQKKWHLEKFANLFQNLAVSDLTKGHIDRFFLELPNLPQRMANAAKPNSPKARNHYRGSLRQFFAWAVRNDLLPLNHRLNEAESMKSEPTNGGGETLSTLRRNSGGCWKGRANWMSGNYRLIHANANRPSSGIRSF